MPLHDLWGDDVPSLLQAIHDKHRLDTYVPTSACFQRPYPIETDQVAASRDPAPTTSPR